jgi:hypothetical protein
MSTALSLATPRDLMERGFRAITSASVLEAMASADFAWQISRGVGMTTESGGASQSS